MVPGCPPGMYSVEGSCCWGTEQGVAAGSGRQPEIKEAVLRGAVPLQLYRVVAEHAPEPRATIRHMQLTAIKRADAQLQHHVQVYAQEAQQTSPDRRTYSNLPIHYQHIQPSD